MQQNTVQNISSANSSTTSGTTLDARHIFSVSVQALSTGTPTGTVKLQASNDIASTLAVSSSGAAIPVNWIDISGATVSISAAGAVIIPKIDMCYRWIRSVFTATGAGVQTVAPIADTGARQHQTVTTVPDVAGSLNSKYFLLSSVNLTTKAQKNFYLWLDDGAGVDPAVAGRTGIHVTYSDGDTANTIATNIRTALNALTNDFAATGSNAAVIITNVAFGPVTAAVDGAAPTGFTFGSATLGIASNLNNTYFLLGDEADAHKYYVWMNVDGIGTDPVVSGRTAAPVAFNSGSSAGTIGTALATEVASLNSTNSFTATGTTTVTITNKTAGPFTPASDVSTGFAFAVTAGGGSTTVNINSLGD